MPVIPARKGFGPGKAGWSGWRDKVGMTIRPGPNVFVIVAHAAWGGVPAGRIPARLFRSFHYPGDRLGKYRLDAEYTWCLDHAMLMALGPHVYSVVPPDVLAAMALDRRMVVETNPLDGRGRLRDRDRRLPGRAPLSNRPLGRAA